MSMLAPYRKKGGFLKILKLVEESASQQRDRILQLIDKEDPYWGQAIRNHLIRPEDFLHLNEDHWMRWWKLINSPRILALGFASLPTSVAQEIQKNWGRDLLQQWKLAAEEFSNPSEAEKQSAWLKWVQALRQLIEEDSNFRAKGPAHWQVPEDIEVRLGEAFWTQSSLTNLDQGQTISSNTKGVNVSDNHQNPDWMVERQKLMQAIQILQNENQQLKRQLQAINQKLEQIRKLAS